MHLEKEFDLVRLIKRSRQTEGLLYAMTTKGQRRLASWQARHVLQLGFKDDPQFAAENKHGVVEGASVELP